MAKKKTTADLILELQVETGTLQSKYMLLEAAHEATKARLAEVESWFTEHINALRGRVTALEQKDPS